MTENPLALPGNFSGTRPDDVKTAIQAAQQKGINVAEHAGFQALIAHLLKEFKKREARYAPNTLRRLESAWRGFVDWCVTNQRHSLPATPDTVEAFFIARAEALHRNALSVYRWAISRIHRVSGCPDPCQDVYVEDRLRAITRNKVRDGEAIKQASPFHEQHLLKLTALWYRSDKVLLRRNLALLAVAYESMLRAAELVNIRLQDLALAGDGTATLTIPITKTNHSGEPDTCVLSQEVVGLLMDYTEAGKLDMRGDGFLFVGVSKHNACLRPKADKETGQLQHKPITPKTVEGVFYTAWEVLELKRQNVVPFTAHSARVGAAQDLLKKGYNTLQIQQSGRWASGTMVVRYGRAILAREGAMAHSRIKTRPTRMNWGHPGDG
ncbi:tyrosine-type recombinase/integrase [Xenorhabdus bovienii]|uniref:Tyrosine-type recombinase/integrase n=1 Tax=Xenorhabdus bovienii TaxID=40576 RepID=A0AAJ1N0X1_XENBV|nr:tyrosine-type recombinase/integrase [Xenorhabdus bovienii]MDE1480264.1 tyrosine-type recombinase/integrase [Xenorhabdus bovienii]MDE1492507.1 tyrosine-type recombinase/integrase [Xenorhabdus bovienii]MDE9511934.1 tyrosine-type recombinase/integrase [Xenorhabdus bovienii]MDE9523576.1 tyrosine-type recombinase/integrase [Xenorhabdus bovienii]